MRFMSGLYPRITYVRLPVLTWLKSRKIMSIFSFFYLKQEMQNDVFDFARVTEEWKRKGMSELFFVSHFYYLIRV